MCSGEEEAAEWMDNIYSSIYLSKERKSVHLATQTEQTRVLCPRQTKLRADSPEWFSAGTQGQYCSSSRSRSRSKGEEEEEQEQEDVPVCSVGNAELLFSWIISTQR